MVFADWLMRLDTITDDVKRQMVLPNPIEDKRNRLPFYSAA